MGRAWPPDLGHRAQPGHRLHQRAPQPVEQRLLQCAAGQELHRLLEPARPVHVARRLVHRGRGVSDLPQPMLQIRWRRCSPSATWAPGSPTALLPYEAHATGPTNPTKHRGRSPALRGRHAHPRIGVDSRGGDPGGLPCILWGCPAQSRFPSAQAGPSQGTWSGPRYSSDSGQPGSPPDRPAARAPELRHSQRYEADFRFSLVRSRENAEGSRSTGEADELRTSASASGK